MGHQGHRNRVRTLIRAAAIFSGLLPAGIAGAQTTWLGGEGNWSDPTKWSGGVVPNSATLDVVVDGSAGQSSTVRFDQEFTTVRSITVDAGDILTSIGHSTVTTETINLNGTIVGPAGSTYGIGFIAGNIVGTGLIDATKGRIGVGYGSIGAGITLIGPYLGLSNIANAGTIRIGADATIHSQAIENTGLIEVSDSTLHFSGFTNNGTIKLNSANLIVDGTQKLGHVERDDRSLIAIAGVLWMPGETLMIDDSMGDLVLYHTGRMVVDRIESSGSGRLVIAENPDPDPLRDGLMFHGGVTLATEPVLRLGRRPLEINGGLTLDHIRLDLSDSSGMKFGEASGDNEGLAGTGEVLLGNGGSKGFWIGSPSFNKPVTLGANIRVHGGSAQFNTLDDRLYPNRRFVNEGSLGADVLGALIQVSGRMTNRGLIEAVTGAEFNAGGAVDFRNEGTIRSDPGTTLTLGGLDNTPQGRITVSGGTLRLTGNWQNAGQVDLIDSRLELGGTFNLSRMGSYNVTGDCPFSLVGTMINDTPEFVLDASTGPWTMREAGAIVGGHVDTGAFLKIEKGRFEDVTFHSAPEFKPGANLTLHKTVALDNITLDLSSGDPGSASLVFQGTSRIDGTGEIKLSSANKVSLQQLGIEAIQATFGPGIVVRASGGTFEAPKGGYVNEGTIIADHPGGAVSISSLTNKGLVRVANGAILTLSNPTNQGTVEIDQATLNLAAISPAQLGQINRIGGTINITGKFVNTGNDLTLDALGGWNLAEGGSIVGGTVSNGSATQPLLVSGAAALDGVAVSAALDVQPGAKLSLLGNWSVPGRIAAHNAALSLGGVFGTIGQVELVDSTLEIASNLKTSQVRQISRVNTPVTIVPGKFLDNKEDTIDLDDPSGTWRLSGGSISGGTIRASGASRLDMDLDSRWNGVSLAAPMTLRSTLRVDNSLLLNPSQVSIQSAVNKPAGMEFFQWPAIKGSGEIVFDGDTSDGFLKSHSNITVGVNVIVRTGSQGGVIGGDQSGGGVINQGSISAQTPNKTIQLVGTNVRNTGTFEARDRGRILIPSKSSLYDSLGGTTLYEGTWSVASGGVIEIPGATVSENQAKVILSGNDSVFAPFDYIARNLGQWTVTGGRIFKTKAGLYNAGRLTIGSDSGVLVNGALTHATTGSPVIDLSGALVVRATADTRENVMRDLTWRVGTARNSKPTKWYGPGITSLAAKGDPLKGLVTIINDNGQGEPILDKLGEESLLPDDVLVVSTWNGDVNVDGKISADDYFMIDQGFLLKPAFPTYRDGDFNYDLKINADDYFLIDSAFLGQTRTPGGSTPVPEPSALALLAAATSLISRRRRTP